MRSPTVNELADDIGSDPDEILEAMEADGAWQADSLDAPTANRSDSTRSLGDRVPDAEAGYELTEVQMMVRDLLDTLPERDAEILRLRFYEDLTQSEIAERIGVSQMHVSRLLRKSLTALRTRVEPPTPA